MHENNRAIRFALIICIVCSGLLSFAAQYLRPYQEENIKLDQMKNIVKALNIREPGMEDTEDYFSSINGKVVTKLYTENIEAVVIDSSGTILSGVTPADLKEEETMRRALYLHKVNGAVVAYCLPVSGKGLWSTIKGYLALESNLNTIKGLTFYSHAETPGLGGEIDKDWFTNNYRGKEILNADGSISSITIVKGKVIPTSPSSIHQVDGISGATLTGNGINAFMKKDLAFYAPYMSRLRAEQTPSVPAVEPDTTLPVNDTLQEAAHE